MRIALCTDQYLPMLSGIADSVEELAQELRRRGHTVRIYGPELPGSVPDEHVFRFPAFVLPGGIALNLPLGALRDMRRFKPDVIHTHLFGAAGWLAWYAARRLGVPLVGTDHTFPAEYLHFVGLNFPPMPYLVKAYASWYYQRCAFVTTPSTRMLLELHDYGMTRPTRVISNPVTAHFRPLPHKAALKKKYDLGAQTIVVFGRIDPEKNLGVALDVFERVAAKSSAELIFIGDGSARAALEARAQTSAFADRIRFLGAKRGDELVELLNACDLFFITSLVETQSMVLIQAMACGLPAIAARAGGLAEYVDDGATGYSVEPDDVEAFTARMLELLENSEKAARFSRAAIEAAAPFSSGAIAEQFERVYSDALASRKK